MDRKCLSGSLSPGVQNDLSPADLLRGFLSGGTGTIIGTITIATTTAIDV
jgi:hypothetical protein